MTPQAWVALAYGVVAVTLLIYTARLRGRLRRYATGAQHDRRSSQARGR